MIGAATIPVLDMWQHQYLFYVNCHSSIDPPLILRYDFAFSPINNYRIKGGT